MVNLERIRVNSCCCGCSVRKGTLILLYIQLSFGVLSLLNLFQGISSGSLLATATSMFAGILSAVGIHGIQTNKEKLLLPKIIFDGIVLIGIVLSEIIIVFALIFIAINGAAKNDQIQVLLVTFVLMLLFTALSGYFLIVKISCYLEIKEANIEGISASTNQNPSLTEPPSLYSSSYAPQTQGTYPEV